MSLKADTLKFNEAQKSAIAKEVRSILHMMDDQIKIDHKQGKQPSIISVPTIFPIPFMTNQKAQLAIYYRILVSLKERGFDVNIELRTDKTNFIIRWQSKDEISQEKRQYVILMSHAKVFHAPEEEESESQESTTNKKE